MSRLHGITYNKKQWDCWSSRNYISYSLKNKKTLDTYSIVGDIIGMEQIDDSSFLVYRIIPGNGRQIDRQQIIRMVFNSGCSSCIFLKSAFKNFYFLSEDTILFDNKCVYSISQNCEIPEFEWLKSFDLEVFTDEKKNSTYLWVKKKNPYTNDCVQVFVDTKKFQPITSASSSLRNNHHITLSDEFTFLDLVREDESYARSIFHNTELSINTAKETLMKELQITVS